jgi:hypothetical protein
VNVPDSAVKAATTGLTAGAKGVAKEAETELVRIGDRYRDEFQATVKELTEGLVRQSNVMPRAFGAEKRRPFLYGIGEMLWREG